jgi:hypothetical protein
MIQELQTELERLVGGNAAEVVHEPTTETANRRVQLKTANAVYSLPANELLIELRKLPDKIGVEALRQTVEHKFAVKST